MKPMRWMNQAMGKPILTSLVLVLGLLAWAPTIATAQEDRSSGVETTRSVLEKWVETRRIISKEKKDWDLGREVMADRCDILRREIESLRNRMEEAQKSITEAEKKKADLMAERDQAAKAITVVRDSVEQFEERTRKLTARLPEPVRERVRPLSQRIPEAGKEASKASLGERFATVVGLLNSVGKFNREISVQPEVMSLADGKKAEVTALYLGLGQGYYISPNGKHAGIGTADEESWVWTAADEFSEAIGRMIAIYKNEQGADFVPVPVRMK